MAQAFTIAHTFTAQWEETFLQNNSALRHDISRHWLKELHAHFLRHWQEKDTPFSGELLATCMEKHFWKPLRCATLPLSLSVVLYDSAVHMGVPCAVTLLQECCNVVGEAHLDIFHPVNVDGIVGKNTVQLTKNLAEHNLDFYTARMAVRQRLQRYGKWAQKNPPLATHLSAWKARCQALLELLAQLERESN